MTEAEIRAEWKRPWKCEKCGRILDKAIGIHYYQSIDGLFLDELCEGKLVPLDRRSPDPEKLELWNAIDNYNEDEARREGEARAEAAMQYDEKDEG